MRYVYLIRHGRIHKIGHSCNPLARLWQLVPAGADAEVAHQFPSACAGQVERALHRRFGTQRLHGEWFSLEQADVDLICQLGRTDSADDLPPALQAPAPRTAVLYAQIPEELMLRLRRHAERHNRTLREQVEIILRWYLATPEAVADLASYSAEEESESAPDDARPAAPGE